MEKTFNLKLSGNEVYCTNALILLTKIVLCSKLHCQEVLKLKQLHCQEVLKLKLLFLQDLRSDNHPIGLSVRVDWT